jgi:hypothetical protein
MPEWSVPKISNTNSDSVKIIVLSLKTIQFFFLSFFFYGTWVLISANKHFTTWDTLLVHLGLVILEIGYACTICPIWSWTSLLLFPASQVHRTTGVSQQHQTYTVFIDATYVPITKKFKYRCVFIFVMMKERKRP